MAVHARASLWALVAPLALWAGLASGQAVRPGPPSVYAVEVAVVADVLTVVFSAPQDKGNGSTLDYEVVGVPLDGSGNISVAGKGITFGSTPIRKRLSFASGQHQGAKAYNFTVTASNCAGAGPASEPFLHTPSPPSRPNIARIAYSCPNRVVKVVFTGPKQKGTCVLGKYRAQAASESPIGEDFNRWGDGDPVTTNPFRRGLAFAPYQLRNGKQYTFRVWASNCAGEGPSSRAVNFTVPRKPSPPTVLSANITDANVLTVLVLPPTNKGGGGLNVTSYRVVAKPKTGSPIELKGPGVLAGSSPTRWRFNFPAGRHEPGMQYRVKAYARNCVAEGPGSAGFVLVTPKPEGR